MVDKQKLDKVMERIRKLLALAKSSNEHEAGRAAEIAQAMLAEYNLSEQAVVGAASVEYEVDDDLITDAYPWRRPIAVQVAKLYFCKYYYTPVRRGKTMYDQHAFVGQRHNIAVAKLMFEYLIDTVDRLAREAARIANIPAKQRSPYRVSFRTACVARLCERIMERIEAAKQGGTIASTDGKGSNLPALLDMYNNVEQQLKNFLEVEKGMKFTKPKRREFKRFDQRGIAAGDKAGGEIGLDNQIEGDTKRRALPDMSN